MTLITNETFKTSFGTTYIFEDLKKNIKVGDVVKINGETREVKKIKLGTTPAGANKCAIIAE